MPTVWFSLKKSLHCKSEPSDVYEPKAKGHLTTILTRKPCRSGCSRSIANLKDVIHGGKRELRKPAGCSPRSIGSNEFINPLAHEVVFSGSRCELKITGFRSGDGHEGGAGEGSTYMGTLRTATPGSKGGCHSPLLMRGSSTPPRKSHGLFGDREDSGFEGSSISDAVFGSGRGAHRVSQGNSTTMTCHRCREQFGRWEALEAHHLSNHAVTELLEGDSSRKIIEMICKASLLKSDYSTARIEKVLKVHNMQRTLARFEEYRDTVKIKASKLPKKHPRCLADGNELLRFYGTTIYCSLGMNSFSSLCTSVKCNVCRIIKHGFSEKKEFRGGIGVFTTSSSGRALDAIEGLENTSSRKALLVCRVIAGRVHKPMDNLQDFSNQSGFDSVAGKVGLYANIEELYLLNPQALLPCFVVVCKP
ncbi:uncharacterized protein [Typha angustifolia]|uniref:uncharacterized protein n=1 Tax=Typha angustifolia TaxID=59011 RepID=UPI003C2F2636